MKKSWYIVQTYAGLEETVKEAIEQKRDQLNLSEFIGRVFIPEEKVVDIKSGPVEKIRIPATAKFHVNSGDDVVKDQIIAELPEVHSKHDGRVVEVRNMRKLVVESIDRKNSRTYYIPASTGIENGIRLGAKLTEGMPISKDKSFFCEIDGKVVQNDRVKKIVIQPEGNEEQDFYFVPIECFNKEIKVNKYVRVGEKIADKKVFLSPTSGVVEIDAFGAYKEVRISKVISKRLFPGYVFVEMFMNEDSWEIVKNTEHVINFVSNAGQPIPLKSRDVNALLSLMNEKKTSKATEEIKIKINLEVGERVKIKSGPFEGFSGTVKEIKPDKKEVTVAVTIFGRETPVVLNVAEVEKSVS
ncbi:MAG: transcription termination/antitermination factor NusG [Mesoaciditoga sp.]|uniref:transcription termination/antitermination protein NusG n=1 Tax=Athalassotoga sp. TaxID=2022597 RepID=UPI000CBD2665|nr:MAG: transcription termination/antitermination factor NusG [Mesoaciditoga sp.]PMP80055.1 MAG: transcription termination/antitermination factor NusG [Mesoaciditoga sp.]HEU24021.1 transcription termination/antitermination factor NusG [Mesoaciditoga lauensis]